MNQQTTNQTPEPKQQCKGGLGRKARLGVAAAALIGIGALAGVLISNVSAHSAFGGHGAWGSRDHHYHGASSIEKIRERALDKAAWALGSVDATPEQSKHVKAIVVRLVEEIYPLRQQHHENRRSVKDVLSQPQIDRQALEQIRQDEMGIATQISEKLITALADSAEVLTVEQRLVLINRLQRFAH
ncbi:MAG: periplasmic heavy metal sensor [Gammaproteobacteria bacterium]|nr:periplasmic heavy metal sensor [Gammaproteobacteria bacterium]